MICRYYFGVFKKGFIYLFLERGREGEREGEHHHCAVASYTPPTGDLAHSPGMCSDWELNQQPFVLQVGTPSTEPHQPGWYYLFSVSQNIVKVSDLIMALFLIYNTNMELFNLNILYCHFYKILRRRCLSFWTRSSFDFFKLIIFAYIAWSYTNMVI